MIITFLQDCRLSEDGFAIKRFAKGQKENVADHAAKYALRNGWAFNSEPYDDEAVICKDTAFNAALDRFVKVMSSMTDSETLRTPTNPATHAAKGEPL
jgi:hypothetical protein